jgi:hypothetical protein
MGRFEEFGLRIMNSDFQEGGLNRPTAHFSACQ